MPRVKSSKQTLKGRFHPINAHNIGAGLVNSKTTTIATTSTTKAQKQQLKRERWMQSKMRDWVLSGCPSSLTRHYEELHVIKNNNAANKAAGGGRRNIGKADDAVLSVNLSDLLTGAGGLEEISLSSTINAETTPSSSAATSASTSAKSSLSHSGGPVSQKARRRRNLDEMLRMQKVLNHEEFKRNPLNTVLRHLQNSTT